VVFVTTTVHQETVVAQPAAPARSPRLLAIEAIMRETDCSKTRAKKTLDFVFWLVRKARRAQYGLVFPTNRQLASPSYGVFHQVIPHGQYSSPGSAHQAIEDVVLDRSREEVSIYHDMTRDGTLSYCGVQVVIDTIS